MSSHISRDDSWSFNGGKGILKEKQLVSDLAEIAMLTGED